MTESQVAPREPRELQQAICGPWLTLIGIGEEGRDGLSPRANAALDCAHTVIGGKRHLVLAAPLTSRTMTWPSPIEAIVPDLLALRGTPVAVLATGDPFHYGVGTLLSQHVPATEIASFPQPSAFALAASRLCWSLQETALVSLHGRDERALLHQLRPGARIMILSWDGTTPARVAALLRERGLERTRMVVLEAMGGPRERVRETSADRFALAAVDPLNTIALECAGENVFAIASQGCLPDDAFEHDGQITKQSIRAVTLTALEPRPGALLWDVGAGSGSIAIEWLRMHPANRAIAIEKQEDRAQRIERNAKRFDAPLQIVKGEAPGSLAHLPKPDAIFVGGAVSDEAVIDLAIAVLRTGGRLVANAVTLEAQSHLTRCCNAHGGELHLLQHSQATPVGRFSGWRSAMPVVQWRWRKP